MRVRGIHSFVVLFLLAGMVLSVSAQNVAITESQLLYRKQLQFGLNLNTTGIGGLNFRMGWHRTDRVKDILDIELARVRDSKETRVYGASENPQRYTFDRINMAFFMRTGYGKTIRITDRPYKNAISLMFNYNFGVTTAILKPIYIDYIINETDALGRKITTVSSVRYDPNVHNNTYNILGNSSFFTGMSNTTARFGGYGRAGMSVQFGQYPDEFHVIEAGATLDYFPSPLPLMANRPKRDLFFILFIGYTYGLNK